MGVELETTWENLAKEDLTNWEEGKAPSLPKVEGWVEAMKEILSDVQVGERYVIIDGSVFPAESKEVEFDGWHARHRFETLPQFRALDNRAVLKESLDNRDYWTTNALPDNS